MSRGYHNKTCRGEFLEIQNELKKISPLPLDPEFKEKIGDGEAEPFQSSNGTANGTGRRLLPSLYFHWYWLTLALTILGSNPVEVGRPETYAQRPNITFRWKSWISLYCVLIHVIRIALSIWHFYGWRRMMLEEQYEYQNATIQWILVPLNYVFLMRCIWGVVVVWATAEKLAKLGRDFSRFDVMFQDTFGKPTSFYFQNKRWLLSLAALAIAVFVVMAAGLGAEIFLATQENAPENWKIQLALVGTLFIGINAAEEMRMQLMFLTASEGFRHTRLGIKEQLKALERIPVSLVTKWKIGLLFWRGVVERLANFQTPFFIPILIETVFCVTGLLFLGVQSLRTGQGTLPLLVVVITGTSFLVQVLIKIKMADWIREEEGAIVDLLLGWDADLFDVSGQLEIGKILNTLQQTPSTISLNGYFTVEKKLLTKMMSQVVAYLVVLIQFDLGNYVKDRQCVCNNETIYLR